MLLRGLFALLMLAFLVPAPARAQTVQQSGSVTLGHVPCWVVSGVVQDCGPANNGSATEVGITKNGGLPFCISTAKDPASNIKFCLSVSPSSASIIINSFNGATAPPCQIIINGVSTNCSSSGPVVGTALRKVITGTTDAATSSDVSILWASANTAAKTQTLYACNSASKGNVIRVVDEQGSAATYPILVDPTGGDTILGEPLYVMNYNYQAPAFQCDGGGNWVVE